MTMGRRVRKLALIAHIGTSVASLGAVAGFLVLAVLGLTSADGQLVRSAYVANDLNARFVIAPLVLAGLLTGLVSALGTRWGLFRYYWVLTKLLITAIAAVVLLIQMDGIAYVAHVAAQRPLRGGELGGLRASFVLHAAGGLIVLLLPLVLSIYKPPGVTRYGWGKQFAPTSV